MEHSKRPSSSAVESDHRARKTSLRNNPSSSSSSKVGSSETVIGIDLGTSYSSVGVWEDGNVKIIPVDGELRMPSCAAFTSMTTSMTGILEQDLLVGRAAMEQIHENAAYTITDSKRLIGRRFSEPGVQADVNHFPFCRVVDDNVNKPRIAVQYMNQNFYLEKIIKVLLIKLRKTATDHLKCEVTKAVITVPACFTNRQRQATLEAAKEAGLDVKRLLNEPSAAAIAHYLENKEKYDSNRKSNVLIFDLGGGKLDISLVAVEAGKLKVRSTAGDSQLGGIDFVNNMVKHFLEEITKSNKPDLTSDMIKLRTQCEEGKIKLSTGSTIDINISNINFSSTMDRAVFENINEGLFSRCINLVEKCLTGAQIPKSRVNEVVLIGGSTRIPKIQELLRGFFDGNNIFHDKRRDEIVCEGAAIQAAEIMAGNFDDVTAHSLRLPKGREGSTEVLIPKNSPIRQGKGKESPAKKEHSFSTISNGQNKFHFEVYEGENSEAEHNTLVGSFELKDVPKGKAKTKILFEVDEDGILQVSSRKGIRMNPIDEQNQKTTGPSVKDYVGIFST